MSKICQKCSSIINDEHKFCTNCGAKLSENIEEQLSINDKQNNSDKKENKQLNIK